MENRHPARGFRRRFTRGTLLPRQARSLNFDVVTEVVSLPKTRHLRQVLGFDRTDA